MTGHARCPAAKRVIHVRALGQDVFLRPEDLLGNCAVRGIKPPAWSERQGIRPANPGQVNERIPLPVGRHSHDSAVFNIRDVDIATQVVTGVAAALAHAQDIYVGQADDQQEQEQISKRCWRFTRQRFR